MIKFENLLKANEPLTEELIGAFRKVLSSGIYVNGPEVGAFEREFAAKFGLPVTVGVGSGYDALTLSFTALNLGKGEVILPANTYMATALAAVRAGLTPVFAEPDPKTLLLDPLDVARRITGKTVAIVPVHLFGLSCPMEELCLIAKEHGLKIVEDCAQALGTFYKGKSVGTFGDAAAWSFYPTKNLGALGDGGAVTTSFPEVADRIRYLRNYGAPVRGNAREVGMNSRLDELQAAILRVKLRNFEALTVKRNSIADGYDRGLCEEVGRAVPLPSTSPARSVYPVLYPRRDDLARALAEKGIQTLIHYPVPPYTQEALARYGRGEYPVSDRFHRETLSLPLSVDMTEEAVGEVIGAVNEYVKQNSPRPPF